MAPKSKKKKQDEEFSLIPRDKLLALYTGLLRCRMLEDFVAKNVAARRSGTRTSVAAAVALCADQRAGDNFAATARDFLPAFVEGRSLPLVFAAMHTSAVAQRASFAADVRSALAAARKHRRDGARKITVIFGRPATGRQWQTLLRDATNERLPILFVCKGQSHRRSLKPPRYLPAIAVDRDDVVALYRVASEGIAHARRGNGPTLVECIPWTAGRGKKAPDAVAKMESYLAQKGIPAERRKAKVVAEFQTELERRKRSLDK